MFKFKNKLVNKKKLTLHIIHVKITQPLKVYIKVLWNNIIENDVQIIGIKITIIFFPCTSRLAEYNIDCKVIE